MAVFDFPVDFSSVGASAALLLGEVVCGLLGVCVMIGIARAGVVWVARLIGGDAGPESVEVDRVIPVRRATDYDMDDYDYTIDGENYVNLRYEAMLREQEIRVERQMRGF